MSIEIAFSVEGPVEELLSEELEPSLDVIPEPSASLYILGVEICHTSTSYADFCEKMKAKEAFFVDTLRQL